MLYRYPTPPGDILTPFNPYTIHPLIYSLRCDKRLRQRYLSLKEIQLK